MAKWILINPITLTTGGLSSVLLPGETLDDAVYPTATIDAAGGERWPATDAVVAAVAASVLAAHAAKGINEQAMESRMRAAVDASAYGPVRGQNTQGITAALATFNNALFGNLSPCGEARTIIEAYVMLGSAMASGESMVVNLKKYPAGGGAAVTVLTSTLTVDSTALAASKLTLALDPTKVSLAPGDILHGQGTYVAGGGPAAPALSINVLAR